MSFTRKPRSKQRNLCKRPTPFLAANFLRFLELPDTSFSALLSRHRHCTGSVSAPSREKRLQRCRGFARQHAIRDFDAMVDSRMVEHREARPHRAALRIVRAVDHARHARLKYRSAAHRARLDGHVES